MRRYLVTLRLDLPDNPSEEDYVRAVLAAVPIRASLVSDAWRNDPAMITAGANHEGPQCDHLPIPGHWTTLVSDGNEPSQQKGESDGNGGDENGRLGD